MSKMSQEKDNSQISEENMKRYREIFETFDDNQDGRLCLTELKPVIQCCGYNPTDDETEKFMAEFDKDANGTIEFEEFSAFMEKLQVDQGSPEEQKERMQETLTEFKKLDTDGNGYIDREEIKAIMCPDATDEEIDELLNLADTNGDGKLDCEELAKFLTAVYNS